MAQFALYAESGRPMSGQNAQRVRHLGCKELTGKVVYVAASPTSAASNRIILREEVQTAG